MSSIVIHTEEELERVAKEGFYILRNLREATAKWEKEHSAYSKDIKKRWEVRADEFLKDPLLARPHNSVNIFKIEKE